jgi:hypothetical protein
MSSATDRRSRREGQRMKRRDFMAVASDVTAKYIELPLPAADIKLSINGDRGPTVIMDIVGLSRRRIVG